MGTRAIAVHGKPGFIIISLSIEIETNSDLYFILYLPVACVRPQTSWPYTSVLFQTSLWTRPGPAGYQRWYNLPWTDARTCTLDRPPSGEMGDSGEGGVRRIRSRER